MSDFGFAGLLTGSSFAGIDFSSSSSSFTMQDSETESTKPFFGLLRTFIDAAQSPASSQGMTTSATGTSLADKNNRYAFGANQDQMISPFRQSASDLGNEERVALERIAILSANGSLDQEQLQDLSEEELEALSAWALSGAGGIFPPYEDIDPLQGGLDTLDGVGSVPLVGEQGGAGLDGLLQQIQTILDAGQQHGDVSLLGQAAGLDSLTPEELTALASAILEQIDTAGANGASLSEMIGQMSTEDLEAILQDALAGMQGEDSAMLELPESVIKSLAIEAVEFASETPESNLLADLARANPDLMEKLTQKTDSATGAEMEVDVVLEGELQIESAQPGDGASTDGAEAEDGAEMLLEESVEADPVDELLSLKSSASDPASEVLSADKSREAASLNTVQAPANVAPPVAVPQDPGARMAQVMENIERIEQVMQMSAKRGGMQHVSLQLSPPNLGKLSLSIEMRGQVLNATIRAESVEARNMISMGLEQLRRNLEVQGVQLDGFDVSVDHGGQENQEAWQDQQNGSNRRQGADRLPETVEPEIPESLHPGQGVIGDGFVNIVA